MSAPRDLDRMIQSFLAEGPMELPDPSYDEVRDRMEQRRQRAFIGSWRTPDVSNILKIGLAAAAVVLIAVVGYNLLPGSPAPGGEPSATPEPTATVEPSPSPPASPPPLTQTFTSTVHGISLSYPEGWTARAATEPWTDRPGVAEYLDPGFDVLEDPVLTDHLFLAIASKAIGDSTPEEWVAARMAGCTTTEPIAVDGATGLIGANCDMVAVTTAGRGYSITLYASEDDPVVVAPYDRAWFEEVLTTVQLHPEDAIE